MRPSRLAAAVLACLAPAALAKLSPAEVDAKLRNVPVFIVTDASGAPLVGNDSYGVFLDPSEAGTFLSALKTGKPELAAQSEVRAIPLSEVVAMTAKEGAKLQPDFIAAKADRDAAEALRGKDAEPIGNAPVFVVRSGTAYLTVTADGKPLIPVFFTKAQADEAITLYGKKEGAAPPHVEVAALESILGALLGAEDPGVGRISLVPSPAMMAAVAKTEPPAPPKP